MSSWFVPAEGTSQGSVRNKSSVNSVIASHQQINTEPPERVSCWVGARHRASHRDAAHRDVPEVKKYFNLAANSFVTYTLRRCHVGF